MDNIYKLLLLINTLLFANQLSAANDLPCSFPINTQREFLAYTVIDANNDRTKWQFETRGNYTVASVLTNTGNSTDDWLILPAVNMKKDKVTRLRYTMRSYADNVPETYEIKAGQGKKVNNMTITVVPPTLLTKSSYTVYEAYVVVPEDGAYNIGFHVLSPADPENTLRAAFLDDIQLEEGTPITAPMRASDLNVQPAAEGILEATISFKAPTTTAGGQPLGSNEIDHIDILRGTDIITTLTSVSPGQSVTYTDTNAANGNNDYSVIVYNASGASDAAYMTVYVGHDVPFCPRNVHATAYNGKITLTWNPVGNVGLKGYYVDPTHMSYNIYLYDEETGEYSKIGETEPGVTTYTLDRDADAGQQMVLLLAVEAADKAHDITCLKHINANLVLVGKPYDMPYVDNLKIDSPYEWFITDENIGTEGWRFGITDAPDSKDVLYVACPYPTSVAPISSGKISVTGATNPTLVFDYYNGKAILNDKMDVYLCTSDNPEPQHISVIERNEEPSSQWSVKSIVLTPYITPQTHWVNVIFKAYGAPPLQDSRDYQMLSNIRLIDVKDGNMALSLVSASKKLKYNGAVNFMVNVENLGSKTLSPSDYKVILYKNGTHVCEAENTAIAPFSKEMLQLRYPCSGPDEEDNLHFDIVVENVKDTDHSDNTVSADVVLVRPQLPQVTGLQGTAESEGISIAWRAPERIIEAVSENFDNIEAFTVGDEVLEDDGYTIYFNPQNTDVCGSGSYPHAGEAIGWLVFNNIKAGFGASGAYAAHSGEQCLVAFDGKNQMDTWLISPELSGREQTLSFFTGCLTGNWGPEEFNVLYSEKSTDKGDFKKLNDDVLTERQSWDWTPRSFVLPESAKYFAIQVVSKDKMGFKIDDLSFERSRGIDIQILGYNIYVDGQLVKSVTDLTEATLTGITSGEIGVTIVTEWGEGEPAVISFSPSSIDILSVTSSDAVSYDLQGRRTSASYKGIVLRNGHKVVKH